MFGLFGDLFDFNNDGKLDFLETMSELGFLADVMEDIDAEYKRTHVLDEEDEDGDW